MQPQLPQIINTFRCNQSWKGMAPTANGRHCSSCDKEVRDFTGMEPELILQILQQNGGKMCGRIEASKVEYRPEPLYLKPVMIAKRSWWKVAAAASALYLALIGEASAQNERSAASGTINKRNATESVHKSGNENAQVQQKNYKVQGKVTDALTGKEILSANFVIKQKGKQIAGGVTDVNGIYIIRLSSEDLKDDTVDIEFSFVGFAKKVITGVTLLPDKTRFLNVALLSSEAAGSKQEIEVIKFQEPLFCPDHETDKVYVKGQVEARRYTKEEIQAMSTRETITIGHVRATGEQYYIEGVKKAPEPNTFPDPGNKIITKDQIRNHPARDIESIADQLR